MIYAIKIKIEWLLYQPYIMLKSYILRKKESIKVVFVVNDLSIWKSELLYKKMLEHPRFNPILAISPSRETPDSHLQLVEYLTKVGYEFVFLDENKSITEQLKPDILIYQKPYDDSVSAGHVVKKNLRTLIVHVPYGFHNIIEPWSMNQLLYLFAWQYYHENKLCAKASIDNMMNHGKNVYITGTPFMDELLKPRNEYMNPWRDKIGRTRIIYAPHHSISSDHMKGISYSTFFEYADFMLEMAKKYVDKTYWAFKPHPFLREKLVKAWGIDRTNSYYKAWENLENAQVEYGQYIGLFKHSDAMIHDCSTFTQEYIYANRPAMFLLKGTHHKDNLNDFAKATFDLHIVGRNKEDIEGFIIKTIQGVDEKKGDRESFIEKEMVPPCGNTACNNIINAILGNYKKNYF